MRIRKHAKISPLHYYSSSLFLQQHGAVLQTHLCQLNQSPWDVITFPLEDSQNDNNITLFPPPPPAPAPSSYKLDGYDSCAVNGTFYDSEQSITTMKVEANDNEMNYFENNIVADVPADSGDFEKDEQDDEMIDGNNNNNITTMCCKNDGKGWQCSRESKRGHNLCEHHFAQKHNNSAHSTTVAANSDTKINETETTAAAEITRSSRGRPHRPKKSSSSEFYYYSGFGPLWGKKRGPSSSTEKSTHGAQSSSSQMDNEVFDYIDDDDDDNDDDEVENNKLKIKRARKPIKARSLKSLM